MQSTAGPSKKRGHYAARACNSCRRRRCKCDGVHPTCGSCAFYGHDCSWKVEDDARRPATKQLVESLRIKIQVLEAEVSRLQAQNEDNPAGTSNTLRSQVSEYSGSLPSASSMPMLSGTGDNSLPSLLPSIASNATSTGAITDVQEELPYIDRHPLSTNILSTTLTYQYIFHIDIAVPPESLPEATQLSLACDWGRNLPALGNIFLSRLEHDTLLYRSFKYGTSWLLALVPDLFLRDLLYFNGFEPSNALLRLPTPHYSPLLHCCLLAFATAYSDSNDIRSYVVRNQFAAHAKRLLDDELAQPAPSLVQALALLAEYHCGIGERDAGYMYMGMSFRAVRALKLLNDPKATEGGESSLSPQSIINEWLFWSTFAQDKLMVLEFARGYDIPLPPIGVNLPAISLVQDTLPWPAGPDAGSGSSDGQPNRMTQVFLETSKLMIITARITDTIYCQGPSETFVPEDSTAINLHLQLDTWFNKLPSELLISVRANIAPLPYVILINICYWRILMYLHQPFYQRNQISEGPPNRDSRLFSDLSVKMCDRAAYKILQLINIFDQSYGLRFFPRNMMQTIFACGTALILQSITVSETSVKKRSSARQGITSCIRALRAVAPTWPSAEQSAEYLESLLREHAGQSPAPLPTQSHVQDNPMEQEFDDRDVSRIFYHFVHEWNQGEGGSSHSPSLQSQHTASPQSPLMQLGDTIGDLFGQTSREHGHFSSGPLTRDNVEE